MEPASPPANVARTPVGADLDVGPLVSVFRRRLRLFAVTFVIVLATVVGLTLLATPRYVATTDILLDTKPVPVVQDSLALPETPIDANATDTEIEVLRSRALAEKVVTRLRLDLVPEFASGEGILSSLRPARASDTGRAAPATGSARQKIVDRVRSRLSIRRAGLTDVVNVGFESESPALAARVADAFAEQYLADQLDAKFTANREANEWLQRRVSELATEVQFAEAQVQQYKIANNLMSAQGATLVEQEISALEQQRAAAATEQAAADARLSIARQQLARGSSGEDVGEALDSPVIQQLRQQRATLSARVADLSGRYGPQHPEMLRADRELRDIDNQINAEVQRIISNLDAQARVARQRTGAIAGNVGSARQNLAGNNRAGVRLNELERSAESVRVLYESYLNRYKETSAQEGLEHSDARIVSTASVPNRPSYPNKLLQLVLGAVLGVGLGLALVIIAEALDSGVRTSDDVERLFDLRSMGIVPELRSTLEGGVRTRLGPADYLVEHPLSAFAESFRSLRTSVAFSKPGAPVQVVVVTSSLPGEGKTTSSMCLARSAAMGGLRSVIVDCDLRQRSVRRYIDHDIQVGLVELLAGTATLQEVLVKDSRSDAMILPIAGDVGVARDLFASAAIEELFATLRHTFDLIVVDTAPVLPIADTRLLAHQADAVLVLARWAKTPRKAIESALGLVASTGAHISGVVLTKVDMKAQAKSGYGDASYYYRDYKAYYG